jgi:hypothetical protein
MIAVALMGKFYTDEQIQEAIAALERYSPGIWETMKRLTLASSLPPDEEYQTTLGFVSRACGITYPKLSFIAQASDEGDAIFKLTMDMGRALSDAIASEKNGSK